MHALRRSVILLTERLAALEARVRAGDEAVWIPFLETLSALAAILPNLAAERHGALLTTAEMAAQLQISPKTLLKRKRQGEVRPAMARGKLIRWRGDELR
jgi:hypothetical protein